MWKKELAEAQLYAVLQLDHHHSDEADSEPDTEPTCLQTRSWQLDEVEDSKSLQEKSNTGDQPWQWKFFNSQITTKIWNQLLGCG